MSFYNKILNLIPVNDRLKLVYLFLLMLIALFFEILGIGLIIPIISFISNPNLINEYPYLKLLINKFGAYNTKNFIIIFFVFFVFFYLLRTFFLIYVAWKQNQFSGSIYKHLSNYFLTGYLNCSYQFHLQNNSSPMIKNLQVEIELMGSITNTALGFLSEFFVALSIIFILFIVQPFGALIITIFFLIAGFVYNLFFKNKLTEWGSQRLKHIEKRSQIIFESFEGIKELKLFSAENFFLKRFNYHTKKFTSVAIKSGTIAQIPRLYLELLSIIALSISIIFIFINSNGNTTSIFTLLSIYVASAFRILPSVNRMMSSFQSIKYLLPLIDKLVSEKNVIDEYYFNRKHSSQSEIINFSKTIEIQNITFRYENAVQNALENINFTIQKGDFIGIIGESGSGKSTFIDIFIGLFVPKSGNILVDGIVLNDYITWRRKIGYVSQNIYLIDDTIVNNIAFGQNSEEIDLSRIDYVLKEAQLYDFIYSLPLNVQTTIGERGVRFSGGQRQRLGIARALYHDPEILVFDESTSALDSSTEAEIMKSILNLNKNTTVLFITHRLSTIENCNHVYKLEKGRINKVK